MGTFLPVSEDSRPRRARHGGLLLGSALPATGRGSGGYGGSPRDRRAVPAAPARAVAVDLDESVRTRGEIVAEQGQQLALGHCCSAGSSLISGPCSRASTSLRAVCRNSSSQRSAREENSRKSIWARSRRARTARSVSSSAVLPRKASASSSTRASLAEASSHLRSARTHSTAFL